MLLRVHWGHQYSALQHADAMACDVLTCNGMCRGQKSFVEGDGQVLCDVCVLASLFGTYRCFDA